MIAQEIIHYTLSALCTAEHSVYNIGRCRMREHNIRVKAGRRFIVMESQTHFTVCRGGNCETGGRSVMITEEMGSKTQAPLMYRRCALMSNLTKYHQKLSQELLHDGGCPVLVYFRGQVNNSLC